MGFWHTGYMEFHEPSDEGRWATPMGPRTRPETHPCDECGLVFSSLRDIRTHTFYGHPARRPVLTYKGRECGRSRLLITTPSTPVDWQASHATTMRLNDSALDPNELGGTLAQLQFGVHTLTVANRDLQRTFEFDFALASEADLQLVDQALDHLVAGGRLDLATIDAFIMRTARAESGARYREGISAYLYGVLAREHDDEPGPRATSSAPRYEQRYNQAAHILGAFERPPAEAVCGLVALHYNQFDVAMSKTNSPRVSDVAARLRGLLANEEVNRGSLLDSSHGSLDQALSDSIMEDVLTACALPLNGSRPDDSRRATQDLAKLTPSDQFKLRLVAAEALLASEDLDGARAHAEVLRHSPVADRWYTNFRRRLQGVTR